MLPMQSCVTSCAHTFQNFTNGRSISLASCFAQTPCVAPMARFQLATSSPPQSWGHTDALGKVATKAGVISNVVMGAKPGSLIRKVVEKTAGISSVRMLPPFAKQRFTTWFKKRPQIRLTKSQGDVALFPTCLVEYQDPRIGHDMVRCTSTTAFRAHLPALLIAVVLRTCTLATWTRSRRLPQRTFQNW
jgi:hypothetical protein